MAANENLLSKVRIGTTTYDIKDTYSRERLVKLLGDTAVESIEKLGTVYSKDYQNTWNATEGHTAEVPSVAAVKSYVDAQIGTIHNFDVVVSTSDPTTIPAGAEYYDGTTTVTGTLAASANTMYKLYLVKNNKAGAGAHIEWITIRSGSEGAYTYAWEQIGTTVVDLSAYLKTADAEKWTVGGVEFGSDHAVSVAELEDSTSLNLKALSHKDNATGSTTLDTVDSITLKEMTVAGNATVTTTATEYTIPSSQKADYTPAGTIDVVLTQTSTAVSSTGKFTPAGTIAAKVDGSFSALKTAAFAKNSDGVQIEGTNAASEVTFTPTKNTFVKSLKDGTTDAASFTEGAFHAATISEGFFDAGNVNFGTFNGGTAATLGELTKSAFNTDGMKVAMSTVSGEEEVLVFSAAATSQAVTAVDNFNGGTAATWTGNSYTAPSIDTTKFSGGSKDADTFSANKLPVVNETEDAWISATGVAAAQVFTGEKYQNTTTSDTALKEVAFTGTEGDVAVSGNYDKASVNTADTKFTGTKTANLIPTAITYDKADATAAFSVKSTPETDTITKTAKTITVTVS